jgi:hypothetical protein
MGKDVWQGNLLENGDGEVNSKTELNKINYEDVNRAEVARDLVQERVC